MPPFLGRFHVLRHDNGTRDILQEGGREVVSYVAEDAVVNAIITYTAGLKRFHFDHGEAVKCMRYWRGITTPIKEPALLLELSEPGLCYRRLPFDSVDDPTKCPVFEELVSRIGCNAKAFMMFFGSLFFENADRQQYLYLYGEGGNGKGSITRLFQRIFGDQYHAESSTQKPNQFWMSGLVNKRLVVFSETNNSKIVMSEAIKTITGGDPVRVEEKGGRIGTGLLRCKLIIVSNFSPTLSSGTADQRRIILCEIAPTGREPEAGYEEKLWAEAPYIVGVCKNYFLEYSNFCSTLPVERDLSDLATLESEQELSDIFDRNFAKDDHSFITGSELASMLRKDGICDKFLIKDFISYMARNHSVRKIRKKTGVTYVGIRDKTNTERRAHLTITRLE